MVKMTELELVIAELEKLLNFSTFFDFSALFPKFSAISTVLLENIKVEIMNFQNLKFQPLTRHFDVAVALTSFSFTM